MSNMNRREFLQRAGLAIAALGIDPEQLIWQPRQMIAVPGMPLPDNSSIWLMEWQERMLYRLINPPVVRERSGVYRPVRLGA